MTRIIPREVESRTGPVWKTAGRMKLAKNVNTTDSGVCILSLPPHAFVRLAAARGRPRGFQSCRQCARLAACPQPS